MICSAILISSFSGYLSSIPHSHSVVQSLQKRAPDSTKLPIDLSVLAETNEHCSIDISTFQVEKFLGEGAFGSVYLISNPITSEQYALKATSFSPYYNMEPWETEKVKQEIENEIQNQKLIHSPFVVRLYCSYKTVSHAYMLMEYVDGEDLDTAEIESKDVKRIAAQILMGVKAIHDKNIVHDDLHPGNLLLDSNGNIKITDFGISSKATDNDDKKRDIPGIYRIFEIFKTHHISKFNDLLDALRNVPSMSISLKRIMKHPYFECIDWVHFENNDWEKLNDKSQFAKFWGRFYNTDSK